MSPRRARGWDNTGVSHLQDPPDAAPARGPATTSRAVIDLDALAHNAHVLAAVAGTPWMAVVKADAYGHGLLPVATTCLDAGATWLGVAQLDEALRLRALLDAQGLARPLPGAAPSSDAPRILCWLAPVLDPSRAAAPGSALRRALRADLDLSVSTPGQLAALAGAARAERAPARIHLKADTGMSRAGAVAEDLPALAGAARAARDAGDVDVVGLWSHLSRADEPACGSTEEHLARFLAAERVLAEAGLRPPIRHLAATGGLLWHPDTRLDLVRIGIGLYGLSPNPDLAPAASLDLHPVMRLEAPLTQVKRVPAGRAVSYGGTWRAPTDRWLALVPLGYADGIPRAAADGGPVAVAGLRTTIVGRVCMDQVVIDLGPADGGAAPAAAGDLAVLWGDPTPAGAHPATPAAVPTAVPTAIPAAIPTAQDWAEACGTIGYEIVTRLGARVPRVAHGGGRDDSEGAGPVRGAPAPPAAAAEDETEHQEER